MNEINSIFYPIEREIYGTNMKGVYIIIAFPSRCASVPTKLTQVLFSHFSIAGLIGQKPRNCLLGAKKGKRSFPLGYRGKAGGDSHSGKDLFSCVRSFGDAVAIAFFALETELGSAPIDIGDLHI